MPPSLGTERQKAVDILREFVHRSPPEDPGVVCGCELLQVLRFLDALPSRKVVGVQCWGADCGESPTSAPKKPAKLGKEVAMDKQQPQVGPYGDIEELLQAVRVLVRANAQTHSCMQDLVHPPSRGVGCVGLDGNGSGADIKETITALGPRMRPERSSKYSPIDQEDVADLSPDEQPL